jgi:hypothetical protein
VDVEFVGASMGMSASGIDNFLLVFDLVTALMIAGEVCSRMEEDEEEPADCLCRLRVFFIADVEFTRIERRPSSSEPKVDSTEGGR